MMDAADTSRVSSGCMKASPSTLTSFAPSGRTFSVTSAPKICSGKAAPGGMVLQRVRIQQLRARTVGQDQAVRRRAVVIGGGEALIVQPACAAGGDDDGLSTRHQIFPSVSMFSSTAPAALDPCRP